MKTKPTAAKFLKWLSSPERKQGDEFECDVRDVAGKKETVISFYDQKQSPVRLPGFVNREEILTEYPKQHLSCHWTLNGKNIGNFLVADLYQAPFSVLKGRGFNFTAEDSKPTTSKKEP